MGTYPSPLYPIHPMFGLLLAKVRISLLLFSRLFFFNNNNNNIINNMNTITDDSFDQFFAEVFSSSGNSQYWKDIPQYIHLKYDGCFANQEEIDRFLSSPSSPSSSGPIYQHVSIWIIPTPSTSPLTAPSIIIVFFYS